MRTNLEQIDQHTTNAINILRRLHTTNGGRGGPKVNKRLGEELGRIRVLVTQMQAQETSRNGD